MTHLLSWCTNSLAFRLRRQPRVLAKECRGSSPKFGRSRFLQMGVQSPAPLSEDTAPWKQVSPREKRVLLRKGWANTNGQILSAVDEKNGLWVIERSYIWLGFFDVGGRSTVIRLSDGGLLVHSPLALTPQLKAELEKLGPVKVIVSPNAEHIDFATQWKLYYPNSRLLGAPGLITKHEDIPFDAELSRTNEPDESYMEDLEQVFIGAAPFFNEVVFFHRASNTLLVTDLFFNYPAESNAPIEMSSWAWAMNHIYKPVYNRILVRDRSDFCQTLRLIVQKNWNRIIPCHGDIVTEKPVEVFRSFFEPAFKL